MSLHTRYTLTPETPYRFDYFQERIRTSSNSYLYDVTANKMTRAHILNGRPVLVSVTADHLDGQPPQITLEVTGATDQATAEEAANIWRHMLSTGRSLRPFYDHMQGDDVMRGVIERLSGLHLLLESGPFESMILAIIGQQVNLTFAENLKRSLVELCGQKFTTEDRAFYAFPSPEQIAALRYEDLRPLKFSQRKAEYVIDFARAVTSGAVDLDLLARMSNEEAIEYLVKLRGIGRWTAECVLLFGLGRPDLLPAADIGLRNAIQHFYGLEQQPTEGEVREFAKGWQGFESYATYYLWTALGIVRAEQKQQKLTRK